MITTGLIAVPPRFTAAALIGVDSEVPFSSETQPDGRRLSMQSAILDRVGSSEIVDQTVDRFGLGAGRTLLNRASHDHDAAIKELRNGLRATRTATRNVWRLTYSSRQRSITAAVLDDLLDGLVSSNTAETSRTRQAKRTLLNDLQGVGAGTRAAMISIQDGRADLDAQRIANIRRLAELRAALSAATPSRDAMVAGTGGVIQGDAPVPKLDQLRADRSALGARQTDLLHRYGPRHPIMVDLAYRIHDLDLLIYSEGRLENTSRRLASSLGAETSHLKVLLDAIQSWLVSDTKQIEVFDQLDQQLRGVQGQYQTTFVRDLQALFPGSLHVDVLTRATAQLRPDPSVSRTAAIIIDLLAFAGGAADLIIRGKQGSIFSTARDVEHRVRLPVIGVIPNLSVEGTGGAGSAALNLTDVLINGEEPAFTRAFHTLQKGLGIDGGRLTGLVVAVCSALPNEGKTTISACLARSAAIGGRSVVLIDCDGRRKALSNLFTDITSPGLVQWVRSEATLHDVLALDEPSGTYVIRHSSTEDVQDLSVSTHLERLISELRAEFEVIILDTGPVLALAEARVVASLADQVLLVARWRATPVKAVRLALRLLGDAGAAVRGVALSLADRNQGVGIEVEP